MNFRPTEHRTITEEQNMDVKERALEAHEKWAGKIEVVARCEVNSKDDLSIAYTPGVAEPCLKIKDDPSLSYKYTRRHNLVAVITVTRFSVSLRLMMLWVQPGIMWTASILSPETSNSTVSPVLMFRSWIKP